MSGNEGDQLQNPIGAASFFNNGVQDLTSPEEPGWQQPDLVAPSNVNQQLGYYNPAEFAAGGASNQPYNPADLKNVHTGQEQYQGHPQDDIQHNQQWIYDPNYVQLQNPDAHQPNLAGNVTLQGQNSAPPVHMFYQQPAGAYNEFESSQQSFGNGSSEHLHNVYPSEQVDVNSGGDLHSSQGLYADGNEPNLVEQQMDAHIDQPQGEEHRTCGSKSVPDIVSYSKDGNIPSGQEYTDVVPMQQQHNWHGIGPTMNQPVYEPNLNCNNLDIAQGPLAHEGLEFGRSEPDLAPEICGEPVRFEADRMGPDLGMSSTSPIHLPDERILVGPRLSTINDDPDKRSDHSGSSSMMGLSVSESSHSGQHSRSSSFIGEASEIHQQHPPEYLPTSIGDPGCVGGPLNVSEEPTHLHSTHLQAHVEPTVNQRTTPETSALLSIGPSVSEQDMLNTKSSDWEKNSSVNYSSSSHPDGSHVTSQDTSQTFSEQDTVPPIVPVSQFQEIDKRPENRSPSELARMRHKSTEEVDHLVQGGAHPSAFTTVKAGRGGAMVQQKRIMPSPPLWSAEVPALPSNILLTAAAPAPVIKPILPASGIPTSIPGPAPLPIVFSSTGPTTVVQPTIVSASTNLSNPMATVSTSLTAFVPSVTSSQLPPQSLAHATAQQYSGSPVVNVAPPKPLPASALAPQTSLGNISGYAITQPPVPLSLPSAMSSQHQPHGGLPPSQVTHGMANLSLGSEGSQMSAAHATQLQQQYPGVKGSVPHQNVQPYAQYQGGYSQPGVQGTHSQSGVQGTHSQPGVQGTHSQPGVQGTHSQPGVQGTHSQPGVQGTHSQPGVQGTHSQPGVQGTHSQPGVQGTHSQPGVQGTHSQPGVQGTHRDYPQYPQYQGSQGQYLAERSTSRGPYGGYGGPPYDPYGQAYDPYYGYRYGQTSAYNRSYYEDYYRQQEYARRRYYSRRYTDPYQAQYDYNRPRSRQETESPSSSSGNSDDRPNSRQERSQDESQQSQSRRGYDEYGRQASYDRDRHRNSYSYSKGYDSYQDQEYKRMHQQYYDEYYRSQQNTSRGAEEQQQTNNDASSLRRMQQIYYDEYYRSQQNSSRGSIDQQYDDTSFASSFHHTGGNTPEGYSQDMSAISKGLSYYEPSQDASQQGLIDNTSYSHTDGSWPQSSQVEEAPPQRRTPTKFSLPHIIGRFSPGGHLVKVLPNAPSEGATATVEIHSMEAMLDHTSESQELRSFPGPLVRNETHKGDVISFASKKVKSYRDDIRAIDKESATLLWDLMLLLCRQNGTVVGTDLSELILKNHPVLGSDEEVDGTDATNNIPTSVTRSKKSVDVEKETCRFRELLLFGRKKDALENAIRSGLWGHALLLATKMDHRTHASVMTRFANSLPMNDPLQTLYQLMSDRQPAAVTSCSDVNWGDWRPHLAMVLSNLSSNAELDKKSIITLGDSLGSRGLVHASHFCYLMVQLGLGTYSKKSSKMVLIGSSHGLAFNLFSTNEAIQQTEVYEYAQHLANKHYTMPNYNAYKFIYACRLAEHGFIAQALHYCEVIAKSIVFLPTHYSETLVSQVCQMSDRLKYHDVQYFDGRELTQPQWLTDLENIQQQIVDGSIQPASNPETPMPWVESFSNLSNLAEDTAATPSTQYDALPSQDDLQQIPDMDNKGFYQPTDFQGNPNDQYNSQSTSADGGHYYNTTNQQYTDYGNQATSSLASMNVDPGASIGSTVSEYSTTTATETDTETDWTNSNASNFDYFGATTYNAANKNSNTPSTIPSTPKNTMTPPDSPRTRTFSESSGNNSTTPTPIAKQQNQQQQKTDQNSSMKQKSGGGSWLRGLFSRFGGKNDVHLPDDSDKTIEWDENKNKWVNRDGDGDEYDGEVAPPPNDSQLSSTAPPSTLPPTAATGINKFSKRHNVGRNYVDVFKQQGATKNQTSLVPATALFPTIPNNSAPPVNFFTPPPAPVDNQPQVGNPGSQPSTPASEHSDQSAASQQPHFFNPNTGSSNVAQFQGYNNTQVQSLEPLQQTDENLSRTSSMSDLSHEVSQHLAGQGQTDQWDVPAPVEAEPVMPIMFNPHQFSQPSVQPLMGTSSKTTGPTSGFYRQRRAYPTQK